MNEKINKVIYGTSTLIDLTEDTVTPRTLYKGLKAHGSDGTTITGEAEITVDNNTLVLPESWYTESVSTSTIIENIQIGSTTFAIEPIIDFESDKLINKPLLGHLAFMNTEKGIEVYMITI